MKVLRGILAVFTGFLTLITLVLTACSAWIGVGTGLAYLVTSLMAGSGVFVTVILSVLFGVLAYVAAAVLGMIITGLLAIITKLLVD